MWLMIGSLVFCIASLIYWLFKPVHKIKGPPYEDPSNQSPEGLWCDPEDAADLSIFRTSENPQRFR